MYDGWMSYGGQEIFNGPRTKAYLQHLQPSLSLGADCCECDTLAEALGDGEYSTPAQDDAEWFNPYATESGGFYGLIPLAVEGFEDSTWQVPITDLMGDGSVAGRGRRGGRDLRFKMLAVAESEKAMSRGLSWLRDALSAEGCATGDCGGAQVCYLTDCPGCCAEDAPEAQVGLDHIEYRHLTNSDVVPQAQIDWRSDVVPQNYVTEQGDRLVFWGGPVTVERTVTGFVPGMTYRVAMDVNTIAGDDAGEVDLRIPGASETLHPHATDVMFAKGNAPVQGSAVWDFIATECEHRFILSGENIAIGMFDVSLSDHGALAYYAQPTFYPEQATSWSAPLVSNPAFVVYQTLPGEWEFRGASQTDTSLPSGAGEVRSLVTGLVPNAAYRLTTLITLGYPNLGGPTTQQGLVTVYSTSGEVLAEQEFSPDVITNHDDAFSGAWVTMEFTADQQAVWIGVSNRDAIPLGWFPTNAKIWTVGIHTTFVEKVNVDPVPPDPSDDLRRYLRDVVLTSGPLVTNTYPSYTAVMKEIEWTMRANVPDPLGENVLITDTLGSTQWVVPEVVCTLGSAVRTNYVPNPSGEYGVAPWNSVFGEGTKWDTTNPTSATARSGGHIIRITRKSTAAGGYLFPVATMTPKVGTTWTLTVPVRSSVPGQQIDVSLTFIRTGSPDMTTEVKRATLHTTDSLTDWQEVSVTGTMPPGATKMVADIYWVGRQPAAWQVGEWVDFDAVMLEQSPVRRAYFDGDSPDGTWSGAPGNSTSVYERTQAALVYDPDCPPTPDPPRPPDIVNLCLTTPDTWIRYVLELPALATAPSPRTAPVVTITTGVNDARGVRVRVYANPFARGVEELDPCTYCGEFLISYMPPNASLTVDAADKTATIVTASGTQSALSLLFGSDGGPMTWPLLGCAIPYLVTVDVDADVAPLIAASLSVTPIF